MTVGFMLVMALTHVLAWFIFGALIGIPFRGGNCMKLTTAVALGFASFMLHLCIKYIIANGGFF